MSTSQNSSGSPETPVLEVQDLQTHFFTHGGVVKAVDGVDLRVRTGEIVGLVGESGSGKTITGFSVIGLIDPPGRIVGGHIRYLGEELVGAPEARLQRLRGKEIAMIFQDPMMTLNPVLRVDTQMVEAIHAHEKVSAAAARDRARDALAMVGIPSPEERLLAYPHQLSGGMRQRVAIAIALLNRPKLIIADEPTTALDVTIQAQILYEVQKLCRETGTALVWITHDLAVVSGLADRIAVMYAGRIVESGATDDVIRASVASLHPGPDRFDSDPRHPWLAVAADPRHDALPAAIAAGLRVPAALHLCHRRLPCAYLRRRNCAPARASVAGMHWLKEDGRWTNPIDPIPTTTPLLQLRGIEKRFVQPVDLAGHLANLLGAKNRPAVVHAVAGVDLEVHSGEVIGVVGESGCGKSTLGPRHRRHQPGQRGRGQLPGQAPAGHVGQRAPRLCAGRADDLPESDGLAQSAHARAGHHRGGAGGARHRHRRRKKPTTWPG